MDRRLALMLAPALVVIGGLFFGGLGLGLWRSVAGLDTYAQILGDPGFWRSFALTFHIAFTSTLLSALLGLVAALLLQRPFRGRTTTLFVFQLPLTVPHIVGAIGILYLFSQSGSFARLAAQISLIDAPADFPALIYDPYAVGIILQYIWKEVPFIALIALATLQSAGTTLTAAAQTLGASPWQRFRHVTLPLVTPALIGGSAIVFAFAFGAYEIPALLGASQPQALPVAAYRAYTDVDLARRPEAMALAMVIAIMSATMLALYVRSAGRR